MIARLCLITSLIISVSAFGQNRNDSVYFYLQDRIYAQSMVLSPTLAQVKGLSNYGSLQLDYNMERGGFRQAQQAYTKRKPSFIAEGVNELGRFRIGGVFEFNNSFEDSLANGQKNDLENLSTFYPYANKSGAYSRQNYSIATSISYKIWPFLVPFVNLDYIKHWSAGTDDPRLKSDRFIVKVRPGVSLNVKEHAVSVYGLWGYADEQVSIQYKNQNFKDNLLNPDRIYYMNYGYGSSIVKDTSNVYKYDSYKGVGIQYAGLFRNWKITGQGEYEYYHNTNQPVSKASQRYIGPIGVFDLFTYSGKITVQSFNHSDRQHLGILSLVKNDGEDSNLKTTGSLRRSNYKVNNQLITAKYYFLWDKTRTYSKEFGIEFAQKEENHRDILQAVQLYHKNTEVSILHNAYIRNKQGGVHEFTINPYYSFPNKTTLSYNPYSMTEFIKNVVFTDYYYHKTSYWGIRLKGEYRQELFQNSFSFYVQADYQKAKDRAAEEGINPTFLPNGDRLRMHAGIRMFLSRK
ncbi:DUF6850 family outer membrane beta-barrel protein [Sphingobacterium psychroaquaticum]|uniref:DUF6850 domain-containing protein n=1 Tax=Sphingobacterium psychroaquaticum TaxID=561061 RepID=A0A1X7J135_9SPHI|nr:DUF6850 family outer membrane beta-barrel protein [Sphingobacterium psychroaquaticum]SMG21302.1 hypothetical protein SAMN05660862_1335 [Sphingobacterium psychroaquaticum]